MKTSVALFAAMVFLCPVLGHSYDNFRASKYFEPVVKGQPRPNWPDHITTEPVHMTLKEFSQFLESHTWRLSYSCSGRPIPIENFRAAMNLFYGYEMMPILGNRFYRGKLDVINLGTLDNSAPSGAQGNHAWEETAQYRLTMEAPDVFAIRFDSPAITDLVVITVRPSVIVENGEIVIETLKYEEALSSGSNSDAALCPTGTYKSFRTTDEPDVNS